MLSESQKGNKTSYRKFLAETAKEIRKLVEIKIFDSSEREDVVQEILIAIHLSQHTYLPEKPIRPWLNAIAHHKIIDHIRKKGRKEKIEIIEWDDTIEDMSSKEIDSQDEIQVKVEKLLENLTDKQRLIVKFLKLEGLSLAETAKIMGMSLSAVKVNAHRAYKQIRQRGKT